MGSIRLTILACGLFGTGAIGSQELPPTSQLVLSLRPSGITGEFHVGLRNMTNSPIHVLLGYRDGSGHECLVALSLRLTSANGQVFDFVQIGFPGPHSG
jgi:hypothetical protein